MQTADEVFAELENKLTDQTQLIWQRSGLSIRIEAAGANGFSITLSKDHDGWVVALGDAGFHEHFDESDDPLNFIAWCYSGESRLREIRYGSVVRRTVLEYFENDEWLTYSTTGEIFFPFWKKASENILQNPTMLRPP